MVNRESTDAINEEREELSRRRISYEKGTVLHLPPVISPLTAVQAVIAQELRKRDRNKEN
jgi:hypothetical protein